MDGQKIRVLLLEDDLSGPAFWEGILSGIQDEDIEFLHVRPISEAGKSIAERLPDIIVLDLTVREEDGLKVFLSVFRIAPAVPVIVISPKDKPKLTVQAMQEGAEDCLVKNDNDGPSLGRRMRYAVWRQVHLKRLRSLSGLDGRALAAQKPQIARIRQSLLRISRLAALEEADTRLAHDRDDLEAHCYRARLLAELGRLEEARAAYFEILQRNPSFPGETDDPDGFILAAYAEAVRLHPGHSMGHVRLAGLLRANGETEAARAEYESALKLKPDCTPARGGKEAVPARAGAGLREAPVRVLPYRGEAPPVPVLLLISAADGNAPFQKLLDDKIFLVTVIAVEFYNASQPLPPHRLAVNAIGDADLCRADLRSAEAILARTSAPVINAPSAVLATGRADNAARLADIPGVITPATINLPKEVLSKPGGYEAVARHGFTYPFLLRSPGFHIGRYFQLIADAGDLATAVASLPGQTLSVIRYLEARGADGKARKYRVMMIDGKLYPAHLAVSRHWKIHYFTADMADHPDHRAEDEAFLRDMPAVIGDRAQRAIEAIRDRLALDYGGIDFGLDRQGNVLLFEANAYMNVNPPDSDPRWDYRRAPTARILEAARRMLRERAGKTEG